MQLENMGFTLKQHDASDAHAAERFSLLLLGDMFDVYSAIMASQSILVGWRSSWGGLG